MFAPALRPAHPALNHHIRIEREASVELEDAILWYDQRRVGLGAELLDAIDAVMAHIDRWPGAASSIPRLTKDIPARKAAVPRFPYSIVYLVNDDTIRVLAFAHDRRKPDYWRTRVVQPTRSERENEPADR
ncbi:type II toxin-antitoxin system RelE/ParE family toxin [Phytoactinopolyspora halotolerans]|uniref:Type II toxin-antitoxin system RelE/ParE family toxin n=1 Tax=Phytoactinopolyspora halotolerans TaxID=1981512 RepID=A0A6L9SBK6_9ACTN|nr:type II toxin-antitoxin system RelE/ParE family toxin [Phytoactinopolyspora halotolerans]NEE02735.1 type II toxin-antitoxin system RelE/ParE family toxin [Phytoactinopolyspora halotolerans]